MTVINGSSAALSMRICPPLHSVPVSIVAAVYLPFSTQTHKSLYNRLLCACVCVYVGLCLRRRRRCKAPNDLGPRATCGWTGGRSYKLASRRFLCLYLYIFYLLAFRNLFYICFTWNCRVAEAAAAAPALSCDVLLVAGCCCWGCATPLFARDVPVSLSLWLSVCLFVCCCSVNAAGNGQRLVLLFSGLHFEKSFGGFASKRARPVRVF